MKQITRNIDLSAAHDLLERVPRACIAFAHNDGPKAQPVALVWRDNRYFIGLPEAADHPSGSRHLISGGFFYIS